MPEKLALDGATIFSALSAELALARNEYFLALEFYLPLLREKPDLPLARRTMAIAQSVEHYPSIQEIADIWQQLEPENPAPYLAETQSLLKLGKITELTDPLRRLLTLRPDQSLEMLLLPPNTLKADDFRILAPAYKELLDEFPDSSSL